MKNFMTLRRSLTSRPVAVKVFNHLGVLMGGEHLRLTRRRAVAAFYVQRGEKGLRPSASMCPDEFEASQASTDSTSTATEPNDTKKSAGVTSLVSLTSSHCPLLPPPPTLADVCPQNNSDRIVHRLNVFISIVRPHARC